MFPADFDGFALSPGKEDERTFKHDGIPVRVIASQDMAGLFSYFVYILDKQAPVLIHQQIEFTDRPTLNCAWAYFYPKGLSGLLAKPS